MKIGNELAKKNSSELLHIQEKSSTGAKTRIRRVSRNTKERGSGNTWSNIANNGVYFPAPITKKKGVVPSRPKQERLRAGGLGEKEKMEL